MKRPSPYLKMQVLGAIEVTQGHSHQARIQNVAAMTFADEQGDRHQFTWRTISTWYYHYKNHGITGVNNSPRADKGKPRKVTPEEVLEAINAALPHFHQAKNGRQGKNGLPTKTAIYRFCIEKGLLHPGQIARNTFRRFINEYELLKDAPDENNKRRLAFSMQYAGQLWQADTMFGPHIGGRQAKLIAIIDDASRVLRHGEFFFDENVDSMIKTLRTAFYKRGLPEQLYVDNGSIYCCQEITMIAARVGCVLRHTAVRDPAAKGKIERFFRRVRDPFLIRNLDLSTIDSLNQQFNLWTERVVKKDNTFSFRGVRYETPINLPGRKIELRYERHHQGAVVVYDKGRRIGQARLLNAVANGMARRRDSSN